MSDHGLLWFAKKQSARYHYNKGESCIEDTLKPGYAAGTRTPLISESASLIAEILDLSRGFCMCKLELEEQILRSEETLADAHLKLDLEAFERLLHPDYVIIQPGGVIEGKEETMASLRAGGRFWEIAQSDDMVVRLYGNTAVVTGRWRGKGVNNGEPFDYSARFLSLWIREAGVWHNLAAQSTPIEDRQNEGDGAAR